MSIQPSASAGTFAKISLEGARFDGAKMPLETLGELIRYQSLIVSATKARWDEIHPDEEFPEKIAKATELNLVKIVEGSAISVLERPVESDYNELIEAGSNDVDELLREVVSGSLNSIDFPMWADNSAFWDLGKSLHDGERMHVFRQAGQTIKCATVTSVIRERQFVPLKNEVRGRRAESFNLVEGRVPGLNVDSKSFVFASVEVGEVNGWYKSLDITSNLREVLGDSSTGQLVFILGRLGLKKGRFVKILDATFLAKPDDAFIPAARKLASLQTLDNGWMGEDSLRPQPKILALGGAVLTVIRDAGLNPPPSIFPTEEGGVLFEWATGDYVFSIEVEPSLSIVAYGLYPQQTCGNSTSVTSLKLLTPIIKDWLPAING
ncbi:MAG: hypothetical protein Q4A31_09290 [Corynebacterium sp.]|uniref:hypothetical protein n=1 Tax=Corynebacterium sp. TaxID=1720 RepID=UPI0026DDB047|nr:hypothetical protein [Corynebacterium sp.]MDO4762098.1 hypothetical protein [Corynebacterium sp.]